MPKQSKSTKTEVAETTTAPVAPAVTNDKPKKETKPRAPKAQPQVAEPPASQPVAEVVQAVEEVVADVAELANQSTEFLAKLNQVGVLLATLKTEFRSLEKKWTRELKTAQKTQAKRKRKSGNRQPSGFVKPTKISDELASFLGKEKGAEMARTDVTREINKYIRSNHLQDKENGRKINPDSKLQKLLKLKQTDELTYFNLQKYMSPHFSKAEKTVTA